MTLGSKLGSKALRTVPVLSTLVNAARMGGRLLLMVFLFILCFYGVFAMAQNELTITNRSQLKAYTYFILL